MNLCQALGVHPDATYQQDGGPGVSDIVALIRGLLPPEAASDAVARCASDGGRVVRHRPGVIRRLQFGSDRGSSRRVLHPQGCRDQMGEVAQAV
jgi:hypothetical protein